MGDANPIRTLGDYSKPSHEGYRNTIELLEGNNVFQVQIFYDHVIPATRRTNNQSVGGKLRDRNAKESWALLKNLALYDNKSWNDPRDFAKPVKAISLPQNVPSTSDHRLIELEHQVQRLMEAYIALMQPTQVNKITSSCEICSGPHDTQYCMENPEQDFSGALPSDTVKNPKLNVNSISLVLSARSYPTEDPQCSTQIHGSINTITVHQSNPHNDKPEEDERKGEGNPENTNAAERKEEQKDAPQPELKDPTDIKNIRPSRHDEEREIEWLDVEEPLDLVDTSEESVYESLIKEMPKCSLNNDFRIKKGDPRNLKIPCLIGYKFTTNAYIDVDLPMNIMSLAYYNFVRKNRYEYRGRNFIGLGRDMHVFVGNMSYVMDFTILENIETNIDPSLSHVLFGRPFVEIACLVINKKRGLMTFTDGTKEITFTTPYKDSERSELSSDGLELLSSRIILNEDDYDRGCRRPSDLEDGFYRDIILLGPEYVTGIADEGEVMKFFKENKNKILSETGDGVRIYPDGVVSPATGKFENFQVIFDEKKLGSS
ncbi:hypothetical protein Tco_0291376 [Tanacetum coccineum]